MKIGFSVRAWVLSAAAGLVIAGTINSGKAPLTKTAAAQTRTAAAESTETKQRPKHSSLKSFVSRNRRTNSQIEADSIAEDSGIRQASNEVVSADGSSNAEPRKLIERPAVRDAISKSRPANNSLFPSLFRRPQKSEPTQQIVTPRADDGRSAVQQRLEELYRENGQEMPPMDLGELPDSGVQQDIPPLPKAAAQQPAPIRQVSNNPFKRFFTKISPFRKKAENDERPDHVEKMPQGLRQEQLRVQQFNAQPVPAPAITLPTPDGQELTAEPQLLSEDSQREAIQAVEQPLNDLPTFKPAVELPETSLPDDVTVPQIGGDLSDELIGTTPTPEVPTLDDIPSLDDVLGNPFPEVSEAEADAPEPEAAAEEKTPFTGLALESEPAPLEAPAETKVEAPSLPELPALDLTETDVADTLPSVPELPALELPETDADDALPSVPELPEIGSLPEPAELPLVEESSKAAAPSLELPEIKPAEKSPQKDAETKLQKIAERQELKGLKGFCPVVLRDRRDLVDALPQFKTEFEGRTYNFSSEEALKKFQSAPEMYAPANAGIDVVAAQDEAEVEGTLDHAVWYKNRLFLFSSQQTLDQFSIAPTVYVSEAEEADEE